MSARDTAPDILHLVEYQKFIPPFIELINQELDTRRHHFFFIHNGCKYSQRSGAKITLNSEPKSLWHFIVDIYRASQSHQKIILHGLFSSKLILALFLQPWILKKCYWVIWGGDLYTRVLDERSFSWRIKEVLRKVLIPRLGYLITYVPGDVALARQWYDAKGVYEECIMYPSNTCQPVPILKETHAGFNILVGNSADPSNNHVEILHKIKNSICYSFKIFVPLSYGPVEYACQVEEVGFSLFGDDFQSLRNFMPFEDYLKILAKVDIAIFNHKRQQGMGNIISLLGMGKTVAIRSDVSTWSMLKDMGIILRDTLGQDFSPLPIDVLNNNKKIISDRFSRERLVQQLKSILES